MAGPHFTSSAITFIDLTHVDVTMVGSSFVLTSFSFDGTPVPWTVAFTNAPFTSIAVSAVGVGASGDKLRLTLASPLVGGIQYRVTVTSIGVGDDPVVSVPNAAATLTPNFIDFFPPTFSATSVANVDGSHLDVTFNHTLSTVGRPADYTITGPGGIVVTAVTAVSGTVVRLTVSPNLIGGGSYTVNVSNASDAPPTSAGFTFLASSVGPIVAPTLFAIERVFAARENVVRIQFNEHVYLSNILDARDASDPAIFVTTPVLGTVGRDGVDVRPVTVVMVKYTNSDEITFLPPRGDGGRSVYTDALDLILDRPMSSSPARYTLTIANLRVADLAGNFLVSLDLVHSFDSIFKRILEPVMTPTRNRDIANPMSREAMFDPLPDPDNSLNLGTMAIDDNGDYGFDEGLVAYKKRILRRLMTKKNGFAHLIGYGIGIPQQGKKLMQAAVLQHIIDDSEKQIMEEPETAKVKVRIIPSPSVPGLVRINIAAKTKTGAFAKLDFPLMTG